METMSLVHRHSHRRRRRRRRGSKTLSATTIPAVSLLFTTLLLRLVTVTVTVTAQNTDYFCGRNWDDAVENCALPCPSGDDPECVSALGDDYGCYVFTGCQERIEAGDFGFPPTQSPISRFNPTFRPTPPPTRADPVQFCGASWGEALVSCNKEDAVGAVAMPCPNGDRDCRQTGQSCRTDIDCKRPLVELGTELAVTLDGVESTMNEENKEIFVNTLKDILAKTLEESKISLSSLELTQQALGYSFDYVELKLYLTARHRPGENDSRKNLNSIVQEYINDESFIVVLKIKQAAALIQTLYFISASEIYVGEGRTEKPTVVPTGMPSRKPSTRKPTQSPTPPPTGSPTESPTDVPSVMPSDSPSRSHLQSIITSNALSNTIETSYGYLFNIRTTAEGPAIILNGLDFYSDSTGPINYELWTRVGPYDGFRGMYVGWEMIAAGTLQGQGREKYTSIPEDSFTSTIIPGGGDTQAFYLSLNTKDLIYETKLTNGDFSGAPYRVQAATPELELYEGEAVLSYPFPNPNQSYLYRGPQEFLGAVHYDRLPCRPFSMFGLLQELPCPTDSFPTRAPVSMPITVSPAGLVPTAAPLSLAPVEPTPLPTVTVDDPTSSPVESPSVSPTSSHAPTASLSPTNYPTLSPVVPIRTNLVMTLRNVPDGDEIMNQWEADSLNSILVEFLNRHTRQSLVVEGVDLWDQQLVVLADDDESDGTKTAVTATARDAREDSLDPSSSHVFRGVRQGEIKEEDAVPPTINALRLILILRISFTTLPPKLLGTMAVVTTQENHDELLEQIQDLGSRYMYFANISGVDVFHMETLERLTSPPTGPPIEMNTAVVAPSTKEMKENESKVAVTMGAIIGSLWFCLCVIGFVYMRTARSTMLNSKDADNLSKCQQDPIKHDPTIIVSQLHSSRTIPTGASHADSDAEDGYSSFGISRSLTIERPREQGPTHSNSLVVTSQQRGRMLENSGGKTVVVAKSIIEKEGNRKATLDRRSMLTRSDSQIAIDTSVFQSSRKPTMDRRSMLTRSDSQMAIDTSVLQSSRKPTVDRRSMLSRSDSQMAIDTSVLQSSRKPTVDRRSMLSRSDSQMAIDTSVLQSSIAKPERRPNRRSRPTLSRSDSQINIDPSALAADFDSERGEMDLSKRSTPSARKNRGANKSLTQSFNSRQNNKLRKSLDPKEFNNQGIRSQVDTKFEEAILLDESLRSTGNLRSPSRQPTNLRGDHQRLSGSMTLPNTDYADLLLKRPSEMVNEGDMLRNATGDLRGSGTRGAQNNGVRRSGGKSLAKDANDLRGSRTRGAQNNGLRRSGGESSAKDANDLRGSGTRKAQNNGLRKSGVESSAKDANDLRGSRTRGAQNNGLRSSGVESLGKDANGLRGSGTRGAQNNILRKSSKESLGKYANDLRGSGTRGAQNNILRKSSGESSAKYANDLRGSGTRGAQNNILRKSSGESLAKDTNDLRGSGTRGAQKNDLRKSSVESLAKDTNDLRGSGTRMAQNNDLRKSSVESSAKYANDLRGSGTRGAQNNGLRRSGGESSAKYANDLRGSGTRKAQSNDLRRSGGESSAKDTYDLRGSRTRKAQNNGLGRIGGESSAQNANDLRGSGTRKAQDSRLRKSSVNKPLNSTVEDNKTGSKLTSSIRRENQEKQNTDGHDPSRQSEAASKPSNDDRHMPKKHSNNVSGETSNGKYRRGSNDRNGNARGSRKKVGSSDASERGYREDAKRTTRKKASANDSRPLSQSGTQPRIGVEMSSVRTSSTKESINSSQSDNFEKGYREVAKRNARNQTSRSENQPLSQSATASRVKHDSMRRSAKGSRSSGEISSLRQSRVRGSAEDVQKLVKETRKQTLDSSQSSRPSKDHGEMASLRPSSRHGSLDESATNRDKPRVTSRTKSRPTSSHDSLRRSSRHDSLDDSTTSGYEPRVTSRLKSRPASAHDSLRRSSTLRHISLDTSTTSRYEPRVTSRTKASPGSFTTSTQNQSAMGRTERHSKSMVVVKGSDMAALRKSTTRGDNDLTDVQQSIRKRRDMDFADQRRAGKPPRHKT